MDNEFQNLDNINDEVYQVFSELQLAEEFEKEYYLNKINVYY
jgi:hypothetical protein